VSGIKPSTPSCKKIKKCILGLGGKNGRRGDIGSPDYNALGSENTRSLWGLGCIKKIKSPGQGIERGATAGSFCIIDPRSHSATQRQEREVIGGTKRGGKRSQHQKRGRESETCSRYHSLPRTGCDALDKKDNTGRGEKKSSENADKRKVFGETHKSSNTNPSGRRCTRPVLKIILAEARPIGKKKELKEQSKAGRMPALGGHCFPLKKRQ